jgi:hypothetical protein
MTRPCDCRNVTGPVYDLSQCRVCWLARYDAGYRALWGVTDDMPGVPLPATAPPAAPARCRHLGTESVGLRNCPTCAGHVRRKEFACALRLGTGKGGTACPPVDCPPGRACPGYIPED